MIRNRWGRVWEPFRNGFETLFILRRKTPLTRASRLRRRLGFELDFVGLGQHREDLRGRVRGGQGYQESGLLGVGEEVPGLRGNSGEIQPHRGRREGPIALPAWREPPDAPGALPAMMRGGAP